MRSHSVLSRTRHIFILKDIILSIIDIDFLYQFNLRLHHFSVYFNVKHFVFQKLTDLWLGCLHLRQWPGTYLMTLSDWTMSCQAGPPCARHGQWPRWQHTPVGYTFSYKMANFHGVYRRFCQIDSADFLYDKAKSVFLIVTKFWYDATVLSYFGVKICNFAMSKQEPSLYFHLHARSSPTTVPGCLDERIGWQSG